MKLFFRTFGTGSPLVILHGLFGISDNWVSLGRALSEQYKVIIPDARNHGQSPHSPVFDYPSMEEDLVTLLEDLSLESVSIIGHSMGGKTAMLFALHHPEMVSKLVIVDIGLKHSHGNSELQRLSQVMMAVDLAIATSRAEVGEQLVRYLESERLRQFLLKNIYWQNKTTLGWRLNLPVISENLFALLETIDPPGTFDKPALFIRGGASDYLREEDWPAIKSKFPGAVLQTIAKASHWVHADAPGEFLERVRTFLRQ